METPTKGEDVKSHHISGLSEDLTPSSSSKDVQGTTPVPSDTTTTAQSQEPQGGLTGYLKSWVGGGSKDPVPHGDQKLTHTSDFSDGSKAAVSTAPDSSTVPASLQESAPAVGAARTEIKPPVSEYASALEGIAGEPVAHDPSTKYGPALGSLTGDAPAQGTGTGVVGAVTSAAGSVVQTVKHAVGYEDDPTDTTTTSNVSTEKGTGQPGLYSSYNQGSGPSTQGAGTAGGTLSAAELPKSGVVNTGPGGSADVTAKQQPGYIASAAGTVSNAATGLRDSVAGLVGGGYSGTTGNDASAGSSNVKPSVEYEEDEATATKAAPISTTNGLTSSTAGPSATTADKSAATAGPTITEGTSATAAPSASTAGPSSTTASPSAATGDKSAATAAPSSLTAAPTTAAAAGTTAAAAAAPSASTGDKLAATATPGSTTAGTSSTAAKPSAAETSSGTAAETSKAAPTAAKDTPAADKTASAATAPTKEASSAVSGSKGQPPVSAFAADSKSPAGGKVAEISEEAGLKKGGTADQKEKEAAAAAAKGKTEAATGADAVKKAETKAGAEKTAGAAAKQDEKAKSKCCGCVIQ